MATTARTCSSGSIIRSNEPGVERTSDAWRTYGAWACVVGVAFFAVYPACNWVTSLRPSLALYAASELRIPFVPRLIWAYLSMYALFAAPPFFLEPAGLRTLGRQLTAATLFSGLLFILFPAKLGFARVVPTETLYAGLFSRLFALDLPHNLAPSLHVVFSALISLALCDRARAPWVRAACRAWLALLCASTVLVHQHHLLDVASGLAVASICRHWLKGEQTHA